MHLGPLIISKTHSKNQTYFLHPQHDILLLHPSLKHNTTEDWGQNVEAVQKDTLTLSYFNNELRNELRGPPMKLVNEQKKCIRMNA